MFDGNRIMLLITENCNLDCVYCYEHKKSNSFMSFQTAKNILDKHLSQAESKIPIVIEVFGGEAFCNFTLIKQIDDYIQTKYGYLNIMYETTTNGTLVHGEIQEWLYEHKDKFFIALSLDGTKQMHDKNRVFLNAIGTFDAIDIEFFANTWSGCPAKMTVSEKTLPQLAEGIIYLDRLGFKCDATLSVGVDWDSEKNIPILIKELNKLVEYYIENFDSQLCTMLNMDFRLIFSPIDNNYRFCGAGIDMTCYDTQGNAYPCQGFAPVSIGEAAEQYKNFDHCKFCFTQENICGKCQWVRLCPNCYAANFQSTGNIQTVDLNLCQFYKMCILASAKIQCARILKKTDKSYEDQLVLKAVSIVQNILGQNYAPD